MYLCGNQHGVMSINSSVPSTLGVATRLGSQCSMERGKILLSSKWEADYFSLRNTFSSSLAAELLQSFYTYTYTDDSLYLLSRMYFSLSFNIPKHIVKCRSQKEMGSFLLKEGKVIDFSWLRKAAEKNWFCSMRKWPAQDLYHLKMWWLLSHSEFNTLGHGAGDRRGKGVNSRSFPASWQKEALFLLLTSTPGKACGYLLCRRA